MLKFTKVLIANRGEIAVRVIRACGDAGIASVAVYADPDAEALHVRLADEAYALDGVRAIDTYLDIVKLIAIARRSGADAVHPGYGFLSENAGFARAVADAGLTWIGPPPEAIELLGNKVTAREIAVRAGAPLVAGSDGPIPDAAAAHEFAVAHGLPIVIKAAHGGGGRGMRVVRDLEAVQEAFDSAVREAVQAFGRGECFVERFLDRPRHVETQLIADSHGTAVVVGTRDCSVQRRHQKLVEEAPAPFLTADQHERIVAASTAIAREAGYVGAGTVEFLVAEDGTVSFLEVNTRLQVEHPVTEETSGVDLVREQFRIAAGEPLSIKRTPPARGHAIEFRINAEDPGRGFLPASGRVDNFRTPTGPGIRVDSGVDDGAAVPPQFDSLLAKLIVTGPDRGTTLRRARRALDELEVRGVATVIGFHRAVARHPDFAAEPFRVHTRWVETDAGIDLAPDSSYAAEVPAGVHRRIAIELDGVRHILGLPDDLLLGGHTVVPPTAEPTEPHAAAEDGVISPIAGSLVTWVVPVGEPVKTGDTVATVEAMKMETPVAVSRDGVLGDHLVQPGEGVTARQLLARIE